MKIAEYSIQNKVISWLLVVLLMVGGVISFTNLAQLEFPEFPIPQAMINTAYPGASPEQVEEEVTLPLERAIQKLEYIDSIDSVSSAGVSQIMVELKMTYKAEDQPQIWDELRRKINDAQSQLPPGVYPSQINDDFSDVYGILFNISGKDFTYWELENYANLLRRELALIEGVKKVNIAGTVTETGGDRNIPVQNVCSGHRSFLALWINPKSECCLQCREKCLFKGNPFAFIPRVNLNPFRNWRLCWSAHRAALN